MVRARRPFALAAAAALEARLTIRPAKVELPASLRKALVQYDSCGRESDGKDNSCLILYRPGDTQVYGTAFNCPDCAANAFYLRLKDGEWVSGFYDEDTSYPAVQKNARADRAAQDRGEIEVREVTRRQIFLGGRPIGESFAAEPPPGD